MAHHKRGRPKSGRAGCLFCKPHKHQAAKDSWTSMAPRDRRTKERMDASESYALRGMKDDG